jgi:hypothetical protein
MIEALICLIRLDKIRNAEDQIVQMIDVLLYLRSQRRVGGLVLMTVAPQVNLVVEMIILQLLGTRVTTALLAGPKKKDTKRQGKEAHAILTMASLLPIIDLEATSPKLRNQTPFPRAAVLSLLKR